MLHKMIEASLALVRAEGASLGDVARARVDMPHGATRPLIHPYPENGMNALFSGPYAVAASLADGRIDLASFTDKAVRRPEIQTRLRDIELVEATTPPPAGELGNAPVTVTLQMRDGRTLSRTITAAPGSPQDPLTPLQLEAKWLDCLGRGAPHLGPDEARARFTEGLKLASMASVSPWLAGFAQ